MIILELFLTFFKIGLFTFGGGYAMIPMISESVVGNGWTTTETLINFIAISESTPGPFAINIATFVGMEMGGLWGAAAATLGVVLPSFVIILIIAKFMTSFSDNIYVKNALYGLRPAVIGLILAATYSIARTTLLTDNVFKENFPFGVDLRAAFIFACVFAISRIKKLKKIHPIWLIVLSAGMGIVLYGLSNK